ncbi:MAG: class I SAM-dependent methyltransferase [Endomicrobiales bacterium]|nr:class I SAM-dependent methyltransferase [Endomicrobiales bacterium]
MKLDFGCGSSKKTGFIGIDCIALPNVDVVHNLNQFPYPFEANCASEVWLDNVLEHMDNPLKCIEEIHRICKNGAKVYVGVPYFRSFYATIDPTHKRFFGINWFYYFDPSHLFCKKYCYTNVRFKVERIEFDREFLKTKIGLFHKMLIKLAEKKPFFYESKLSHLFPLNSLTFYLQAIK